MATLLSGVSANGAGTGASHSGPATVFVRGTFDGASVTIEVSDDDSTYVKPADELMRVRQVKSGKAFNIDAYGTYYIRAVVAGAGSSTNLNCVTTQ